MLTTLFIMSSLGYGNTPVDMPIIGGNPTEDFAAVGTLVALDEEGYLLMDFCSATLILDDWLLTAAHCVEAFPELESYGAAGFAFVIGTSLYEDTGVWDYAMISDGAMHPGYDTNTLENDIAVLQLAEPIETTNPIPVSTSAPSSSTNVTYVGWGKTDEDDDYSSGEKQTVTVPVLEVTSTHIHTYDPSGRNICNGDSGGAALMPNESGDYTLVGVNSYGFDIYGRSPHCGGDGAAGGAIRVDVYLDWIESEIGEDPSGTPPTTPPDTTTPPTTTPGLGQSGAPSGAQRRVVRTERVCATSPGHGGLSLSLLGLLALIRRRR